MSGLSILDGSSENDARPDIALEGREEEDPMRVAGEDAWRSNGWACRPSSLLLLRLTAVDDVVEERPFISSLGEYDEASPEDVLGL